MPKQIGLTGYTIAGKPEPQQFAFPIVIEEDRDIYKVIYGKQVVSCLTYTAACREAGRAIFHALCCDGAFDLE